MVINLTLEVDLGKKLKLRNPTVLAAGVNDISIGLWQRAEQEGVGAITTKSCNLNGREGYKNPTIAIYDDYVVNAIGLANPGAEIEANHIKDAKKKISIPIIASIFGSNEHEFAEVCSIISDAQPHAIEVDFSCPHAGNTSLLDNLDDLKKCAVAVVENTELPVFAKISPIIPIQRIKKIVDIFENAGIYGITAINSVPAMLIDNDAMCPILSNKVGGLSGKCIYPIALRVVYELRKYTDMPIIGTGGITNSETAIGMLLSGANAIGIGTATYKNFSIFKEVCYGIETYMKKKKLKNIKEIRMDKKWFE